MARVVLEGDSDFALSDGCSSEGEGEGFFAYHRQPELDAEKVTALRRAVEFPTVGCSYWSSDSGEVFMASTDGEEEQDSWQHVQDSKSVDILSKGAVRFCLVLASFSMVDISEGLLSSLDRSHIPIHLYWEEASTGRQMQAL